MPSIMNNSLSTTSILSEKCICKCSRGRRLLRFYLEKEKTQQRLAEDLPTFIQSSFNSLHEQFQNYWLATVSEFLKALQGSCMMHNTVLQHIHSAEAENDGPQQVSLLHFRCHRQSLRATSAWCPNQKKRLGPSRDSISQELNELQQLCFPPRALRTCPTSVGGQGGWEGKIKKYLRGQVNRKVML